MSHTKVITENGLTCEAPSGRKWSLGVQLIVISIIITCIPVIFGLIQVVFLENEQRFELYNSWWQWLLFNAGITFLLTLSASSIGYYVGQRMPFERVAYLLRLITKLVAVSIPAALIMYVYHMLWCPHLQLDCASRESLFTNLTLAVVITVIVTIASEGYELFQMWKASLLKEARLREENLQSQLAVLKSQINPHFLFNTLNSIYVQSGKDVEMARENILQFSELLSYQLYDSREEWVLLSAELEYLRNYIALEQLRQGDAVALSLELDCPSGNVKVAPLLFTPLVENAFKYGLASGMAQYKLDIALRCEGGVLQFSCKNEYRPVPKRGRGGLGLDNLRKRLELLYPGGHRLEFDDDGRSYSATLEIPLKP